MQHDAAERQLLIRLTHDAIRHFVETNRELVYPDQEFLNVPASVFVTLKKHGQLRGCIGILEERYPLGEAIVKSAISAAVHDPRFPPVKPKELSELHVEISVLSPFHEVHDIEEIEVGVHGIHITAGRNRGLLLPQVAPEHHWDRITFLNHTAMKAGLVADAWKNPDTRIQIFSAEVFGEDE
ncbi:MAG: AMMECR1 domain-containing protein [Acidobacteria bacterium]|nr:MAG: AMMECR1 domain-containing protein [Acidobacteriota bacterium]